MLCLFSVTCFRSTSEHLLRLLTGDVAAVIMQEPNNQCIILNTEIWSRQQPCMNIHTPPDHQLLGVSVPWTARQHRNSGTHHDNSAVDISSGKRGCILRVFLYSVENYDLTPIVFLTMHLLLEVVLCQIGSICGRFADEMNHIICATRIALSGRFASTKLNTTWSPENGSFGDNLLSLPQHPYPPWKLQQHCTTFKTCKPSDAHESQWSPHRRRGSRFDDHLYTTYVIKTFCRVMAST